MPKKDYYEILEVNKEADKNEIEVAYRELLEIYDYNSHGTYSLYEEDQRMRLLTDINEAYLVLSDEKRRAQYDQNVCSLSDYKIAKSTEISQVTKTLDNSQPLKAPAQAKEEPKTTTRSDLLKDFTPEMINGGLLKKLRESIGMTVKDVGNETKLNGSIIKMIEDDEYLKLPARTYVLGFVKLYFRIFFDDSERLAQDYIKKYDEFFSKREKNK